MDLVVLSNTTDFVAIKCGSCYDCVEKKLNTKIIKVFPKAFTPKSFFEFRDNYGLKGYDIECSCGKHVSLYFEYSPE